MKVVCVLITHLPVKAEIHRNPSLQGKPILVTSRIKGISSILDFSSEVKGVSVGMSLQEALSRCKNATFIESDEVYYQNIFDNFLKALFEKSPVVENGKLGCVFLDMEGTEGIYGSDQEIIETLLGVVPSRFGARLGLAKSKYPAYIAAVTSKPGRTILVPDDVASFLKRIPIDLLPLSWEKRSRLHDFGLHTMGQIATLSIGSMQAQFGPQGRVAWELSNGFDNDPVVPSKRPDIVTDLLTFPVPTTSIFNIFPAIELLLSRLFAHPSLSGKYVQSIFIQSNILNRTPWSKKLVFKNPVNKGKSAFLVLKNALQGIEIAGPLEDIRITVCETSGETGIQSNLLDEVRKQEQLRDVMHQLRTRLRMRPPVYKVVDVEPWSRIPERRQALVEFAP